MKKLTVFLPEELFGKIAEMKEKGYIKSYSAFVRMVIALYLNARPVGMMEEVVVQKTETIIKRRKIKRVEDERMKLYREMQNELKQVLLARGKVE